LELTLDHTVHKNYITSGKKLCLKDVN